MAREAAGELRWANGQGVARITLKGRERKSYDLPTCRSEAEAEQRCKTLANLAARFRKARVIDTPDARQLLDTAASCAPALLAGVLQVAGELIGGELVDANTVTVSTFKQVADEWTSRRIHKRFPDHVKDKDSGHDKRRLAYLCELDVGGIRLGDIPIDRFTLEHAEQAMQKLPPEAKRPGTRRHYAQTIARVLALAVYPCRIITVNPLPKGFMPKVGKPPAFPYLYPDEDAALLRHTALPLGYRLLWGFLDREGLRSGEAIALRVGLDLDVERGVLKLDENKTDDARSWALDPGVTAALKRWIEIRKAKPGDLLFIDENGGPIDGERLADKLRAHLHAAGVTRNELLNAGVNRGRMRVHDLRGTFVTLALANGKSETWVADRTGHRSSQMINRYRRSARSAAELGFRPLSALVDAIPELANTPALPQKHTWPLGGMADAGDLKSLSSNGIPVRVREGPPA